MQWKFFSIRSRHRVADKQDVIAGGIAHASSMYLSGRYLELVRSEGRQVPAWVWMNGLAHGDESVLEEIANEPAPSGSPQEVVSCIALHVLSTLKEQGVDLVRLQHRTLIPLESALAANPGFIVPISAGELGFAILASSGPGLASLPILRHHE